MPTALAPIQNAEFLTVPVILMTGIALTPTQKELKEKIEVLLEKLLQWGQHSKEEIDAWLDQLADHAHDLHMQLKTEGQEPKHSPSLMVKRDCKPDEKEFYRYMQAAESLLQFLEEGGLQVKVN